MIFFLCLSFYGLFHFFKTVAGVRAGGSVFLTMALILTIVYSAGFLVPLETVVYSIFGFGLLAFAYFLIRSFSNKKSEFKTTILSLPVLVFTGLLIAFYFGFRGFIFEEWDELSHWGLVLKEMLMYGRQLGPGDVTFIAIYPTGTAGVQYYFSMILGAKESIGYLAQAMLISAPLIQLLDLKEPYKLMGRGVFLFGMLAAFVFFTGFKTLLVDSAVSFFFGGALLFYITNRPFSTARLLWFLPILISMGLIKYIGGILSIITVLVILIEQFFSHFEETKLLFRQNSKALFKKIPIISFVIFSLFFFPKLAQLIWPNRSVAEVLTPVVYSPNGPIRAKQIGEIFSGEGLLPYQKELIQSFKDALIEKKLTEKIIFFQSPPLLFFFILLILNCVTIYHTKDKKQRNSILRIHGILTLGFIIYVFGLLVMYLFRFSEYEGRNLASFSRYLNIFIAAWLLFAFVQFGIVWNRRRQKILIVCLLLITSKLFSTHRIPEMFRHPAYQSARREVIAQLEPVIKAVPSSKKVYVIWQKSSGAEVYMTRFELIPRRVNLGCWALGPKWSDKDAWTCDEPVSQLLKDLADYDYLYIGKGDEEFWKKYESVFPKNTDYRQKTLFQIMSENGKVNLVAIY